MPAEQEWYVYMIQTSAGHLYTGITTDLERRFTEHQRSTRGAKFFSISEAQKIVFRERHPDRASASRREAAIKKMTRQQKLVMIATAAL